MKLRLARVGILGYVGPGGLRVLSQNEVSTINGVFSLSLSLSLYSFSLLHLLFSQKGLLYGSEILHGVLSHKRNIIWGERKKPTMG